LDADEIREIEGWNPRGKPAPGPAQIREQQEA
jgi:hypothetical protein